MRKEQFYTSNSASTYPWSEYLQLVDAISDPLDFMLACESLLDRDSRFYEQLYQPKRKRPKLLKKEQRRHLYRRPSQDEFDDEITAEGCCAVE